MAGAHPLETGPPMPDGPEAERILSNLRSLRNQIVTAWRERAVVLTAEERTELRHEIKETCRFLEDLTHGD